MNDQYLKKERQINSLQYCIKTDDNICKVGEAGNFQITTKNNGTKYNENMCNMIHTTDLDELISWLDRNRPQWSSTGVPRNYLDLLKLLEKVNEIISVNIYFKKK